MKINQKGFITTITLIFALVAVLIIVAVASLKASPGNLFYPVKQGIMKVEYWLTFGHEAKANMRFKIMEMRTKELVHEVGENDFDDALDESEDFREGLREVNEDIKEITETGKNADNIISKRQALVDNEISALNDALSKAPDKYKSRITEEINQTK